MTPGKEGARNAEADQGGKEIKRKERLKEKG